MKQLFLSIAAVLGGLSVAAGAFASHALKDRLSNHALEIFETAVRYQMYHALALLAVAVLLISTPPTAHTSLTVAGIGFIVGVILFSGSLYVLSFTSIKWWGVVTPFGGVAFLVGWGALAWGALAVKNH